MEQQVSGEGKAGTAWGGCFSALQKITVVTQRGLRATNETLQSHRAELREGNWNSTICQVAGQRGRVCTATNDCTGTEGLKYSSLLAPQPKCAIKCSTLNHRAEFHQRQQPPLAFRAKQKKPFENYLPEVIKTKEKEITESQDGLGWEEP